MTKRAPRAILLLAVSTGKQADKISIDAQDELLTAHAERQGWEIIERIIIPGHSRVYYNWYDFAEAAQAKGHNAGYRMLDHWKQRDFDVVAIYEGGRFGRDQPIFAEFVRRTIDCGAQLYSWIDGEIDRHNQRMFIGMAGYAAATEIDKLKERFQQGMNARPAKGLPRHSRAPWPHRFVRDATGKVIRCELDPAKQRLFDNLAELILQGVSWMDMEQEMAQRYGHVRADGRPYAISHFYKRVHNPHWWGHTYHWTRDKRTTQWDCWVFDEAEPVPDGITIWRNVLPPVWTGELAEDIKTELRRRRTVVRGKARSERTRQLSGLFICGGCLHPLKYAFDHRTWVGLRCNWRYWARKGEPTCSQRRSIPELVAIAEIDRLLKECLRAEDLSPLLGTDVGRQQPRQTLAQVEEELAREEQKARRLTTLILDEDEGSALFPIYRDQLEQINQQMKRLRTVIEQLAVERKRSAHQNSALDRLGQYLQWKETGPDLSGFWALPQKQINQLLHALLGTYRFVVFDGQIIKIDDYPYAYRQRRTR